MLVLCFIIFLQRLVSNEHYAAPDVTDRRVALNERRDNLSSASTERREKLESSYSYQLFERDCDEAKVWINEKLSNQDSHDFEFGSRVRLHNISQSQFSGYNAPHLYSGEGSLLRFTADAVFVYFSSSCTRKLSGTPVENENESKIKRRSKWVIIRDSVFITYPSFERRSSIVEDAMNHRQIAANITRESVARLLADPIPPQEEKGRKGSLSSLNPIDLSKIL